MPDKSTTEAAQKVHRHREDGEEAIQQTSKVVPIHSGKSNHSVEESNAAPPNTPDDKSTRSVKSRNPNGQHE
jgi:hypothetical protein